MASSAAATMHPRAWLGAATCPTTAAHCRSLRYVKLAPPPPSVRSAPSQSASTDTVPGGFGGVAQHRLQRRG
jgi:hypothetical protein